MDVRQGGGWMAGGAHRPRYSHAAAPPPAASLISSPAICCMALEPRSVHCHGPKVLKHLPSPLLFYDASHTPLPSSSTTHELIEGLLRASFLAHTGAYIYSHLFTPRHLPCACHAFKEARETTTILEPHLWLGRLTTQLWHQHTEPSSSTTPSPSPGSAANHNPPTLTRTARGRPARDPKSCSPTHRAPSAQLR